MTPYIFEITKGPLDMRKRKLLLHENYIEYQAGNMPSLKTARINKTDIKEVRIGMRITRGIEFPVGRQFIFEFRKSPLNVFRIRFSSSVKNRKNNSVKLFNEINNAIWNLYLNEIIAHWQIDFDHGKQIKLAKVMINKSGVFFKKKTSINRKLLFVEWSDLKLTDYHENFYLGSKKNKNSKRLLNVCDDWNAVMLYQFIKNNLP